MSFQIFITSFLLHKLSNFEKCGLFYFQCNYSECAWTGAFKFQKRCKSIIKVIRMTSENVIAFYEEQAKM